MKTRFSRAWRLLPIVGAVLLALPAHAAKVDFSDFAGRYKSTYLIDVGGEAAFGNIVTNVKVPRNGRSATISLTGIVFLNDTPFPVSGRLRMKSNGRLTANSPIMGLFGDVATKPSRFEGRKNRFTFRAVTQPGALMNGDRLDAEVNYTLRFNRKSVTITGSGVTQGPPLTLLVQVKGKR